MIALASVALGAAAMAATYPTTLEPEALNAWLRHTTGVTPEQVIAVTPSAATAIVARAAIPGGRAELLLRAVSLTPEATSRSGVLAWEMRLEVDCRGGLVRAGATTGYGEREPEAEGIALAPAEAAWRQPRPGTTLDAAWRAACDKAFDPPLGAGRTSIALAPERDPPAQPGSRPASAYAANAAAEAPVSAAARRSGPAAVQVVSSPEAADARQALASLRSRRGAAMQGLETRIEPAQVRGRTVYRGLVAGFANRAEAAAFCQDLKQSGQDCLAR